MVEIYQKFELFLIFIFVITLLYEIGVDVKGMPPHVVTLMNPM
mgnify:CR=1 FL=1